MRTVFATGLVLALGLVPAAARAQARAEQGRVIARVVVSQGDVYLQTRAGRPIVVPGQLSLREGDVLTTPERVAGRFDLTSGGSVPLAPLRRYRMGPHGIQEPGLRGGWQPLASALSPVAVDAGTSSGRLIAKVRLLGGGAFHRPRGWPQEVPGAGALSLAAGDELRLVAGGLAQVQMVDGGWLYLAGPALAAFDSDTIRLSAGSGLAKALGRISLVAGPYRIHGGARVFSLETAPNQLLVSALTGVLTVEVAGGKPVYLAPARSACLVAGGTPVIRPIAIRSEVLAWEARFKPGGPALAARPRTANDILDEEPRPAPKPEGLKTRNPDGEGPERRSGPPDPRVEDPRPLALLPLRDRVHALESRTSREFYVRKRTDREAASELATFSEQVKGVEPDEVISFRLFKLGRARAAARRDLDDFRTGRELSFNERPYKQHQAKDARVRQERERLFGQPLFLDTRRLVTVAATNRQNLIAGADALTRDILVARESGQPDDAIARLAGKRQNLLTLADQQTDGVKELIRVSLEPYR